MQPLNKSLKKLVDILHSEAHYLKEEYPTHRKLLTTKGVYLYERVNRLIEKIFHTLALSSLRWTVVKASSEQIIFTQNMSIKT